MVEMSGSKAFVEGLKRENVDMIFGVTGGAVLPICDELWGSDLRFIMARHEQGAAHMADGYARALGRVGVCLATSGPGATNLVTGIATANIDSAPVVAFTGQVPLRLVGTDAFQEVDIIGITASATKYNIQVRSPSEIPSAIKSAFHIASTGRQGAVLVDIPKDCQINIEDIEFPDEVSFRGYNVNLEPNPREMDWAATLLSKARRPVIMAGGGVIASNASPEVIKIADMLMAPVVTSLMGKGSVPSDHPLFAGLCGMHGTGEANLLVSDADVLLVVGARFSDRTTARLEDFSRGAKVIHIDIDRSEVDKNVETVTRVIGDAKIALQGIIERLGKLSYEPRANGDWIKKMEKFKEQYAPPELSDNPHIRAPAIMRALRKVLPRDALVTTEVGQNQMWAAQFYHYSIPRQLISSGGLGTMGFGLPAAIGAQIAKPDMTVIDIDGDHSFNMTLTELPTAAEHNLPIKVCILNNGYMGMVRQWQELFYGRRYSKSYLSNPDYATVARALGAVGKTCDKKADVPKVIKAMLAEKRPCVVDFRIEREENVWPMVAAGKSLNEMDGLDILERLI